MPDGHNSRCILLLVDYFVIHNAHYVLTLEVRKFHRDSTQIQQCQCALAGNAVKMYVLTLAFDGVTSLGDIPHGATGVAVVQLPKSESYDISTTAAVEVGYCASIHTNITNIRVTKEQQ